MNAGHPRGLVIGDGPARDLGSTSPSIGILPGAEFEAAELVLAPHQRMVLVTDGVTEAVERLATLTPAEHIERVIAELGSAAPAGAICDALLDMADAGAGPPGVDDWQDDATALVLAFDGSTAAGAAARDPALPGA